VKYNQNEQVEEDELGSACSTNGEKRYACRILTRKPERNRLLGRPGHRLVDNAKMDVIKMG
jgi:hypothetical protein